MNLGKRIRQLRTEQGLTQRQLADAVGIDFTYLSKIENTSLQYSPSTKTLRKLANELKTSELELLRLAGKLPVEIETIANTKQGLRFLRQASRFQQPEDWNELLAFLEKRRDSEARQERSSRGENS